MPLITMPLHCHACALLDGCLHARHVPCLMVACMRALLLCDAELVLLPACMHAALHSLTRMLHVCSIVAPARPLARRLS